MYHVICYAKEILININLGFLLGSTLLNIYTTVIITSAKHSIVYNLDL